jgi:hypothetical protein
VTLLQPEVNLLGRSGFPASTTNTILILLEIPLLTDHFTLAPKNTSSLLSTHSHFILYCFSFAQAPNMSDAQASEAEKNVSVFHYFLPSLSGTAQNMPRIVLAGHMVGRRHSPLLQSCNKANTNIHG